MFNIFLNSKIIYYEFILFIILFYIIIFAKTPNICKSLYIDNINKYHKVIFNFFSSSITTQVLQESIDYGDKNGWTIKRHNNYPTTDNQIKSTWKNYDIIDSLVKTKVYHAITQMYDIKEEDLGITEYFVVKYDATGQNYLAPHEDGSEFSFIVALNDDYDGGGTHFTELNKTVKLNIGDCLVFSGQNRHQGVHITRGIRYILTGFLYYKSNNYCDKYLESVGISNITEQFIR